MRILVIGQCTLHCGRMEFGNIGNYYIVEPFFKQLHRVFPNAEITTTFQMSDAFCEKENISCLPMKYYYNWQENDLNIAYKECAIASIFRETEVLIERTPFINEVFKSDLIIDFSGDMWGENGDLAGKNRFLVGLLKDRTAQLLNKPTVMLAGSPGPFRKDHTLKLAQIVFENFKLVTNREKFSRNILQEYGFDISKVYDLACPAFLFEPKQYDDIYQFIKDTPVADKNHKTIGFILCGWNFEKAPHHKYPRNDNEYELFTKLIIEVVKILDVNICLMSHSNGFVYDPDFKLIKGRDFLIVEQLYNILKKTEVAERIFILDGIYSPSETKAIIGQFDMLISGRIHAAVAGLSQTVPTVIIDYGHEPKAHKLQGFAEVAGIESYVANPASLEDMQNKIVQCWEHRILIRKNLRKQMQTVRELAEKNFDLLKNIFDGK